MHRKRINISLSEDGIYTVLDALMELQSDLQHKCELFVDRLADVGIATAQMNCGVYGEMIMFSKEIRGDKDAVKGKVIAVGSPIIGLRHGVEVEADPLLLAEFGSGWNAKVLDRVDGVGQGTFPGQIHAFDPDGWWYVGIDDGETYHTYGETPTFPMHSACIAMLFEINRIAKEVFGNG